MTDEEVVAPQKRRVEITEETGIKDAGQHYEFGDLISLPIDKADLYIKMGWAKCAATGESGERRPGVQTLDVQSVEQDA